MESAQRELMGVLLGRILSRGLISEATYSKAVDLARSMAGPPELFQHPARPPKEVSEHGYPQDTQ